MTLMTQAGIPDTVKHKCGWIRIACDHLYRTQLEISHKRKWSISQLQQGFTYKKSLILKI